MGRARSGVPMDLSTPDVLLLKFLPPSKSGPESPGHREREKYCKTKHCWGSVGRARCRHGKVVQNPYSVYYYSAVQYSWSIHPRETRSPGRRGWCAVQRVSIWVFFFLKSGWALNQEIKGSAPPPPPPQKKKVHSPSLLLQSIQCFKRVA